MTAHVGFPYDPDKCKHKCGVIPGIYLNPPDSDRAGLLCTGCGTIVDGGPAVFPIVPAHRSRAV